MYIVQQNGEALTEQSQLRTCWSVCRTTLTSRFPTVVTRQLLAMTNDYHCKPLVAGTEGFSISSSCGRVAGLYTCPGPQEPYRLEGIRSTQYSHYKTPTQTLACDRHEKDSYKSRRSSRQRTTLDPSVLLWIG